MENSIKRDSDIIYAYAPPIPFILPDIHVMMAP